MAELADAIRRIPLFSGLSREDVAKVLGKLEEKSYAAGTTIFSQGDQGDAFYFIHDGAVEVVLESSGGRSETIAVLGPQDSFGEMALLSGEPRSATIVAVKDTTVWRLSRQAWDELIEKHPTWLLHFCALLSKRLAHIEHQYSTGRDAFNSLAEEFYGSRPPQSQRFFRHAALLATIDPETVDFVMQTEGAKTYFAQLVWSHSPLIRSLEGEKCELHAYFRDLLLEKLLAEEGREAKQQLHAELAGRYETLKDWPQAIHHRLEAQEWPAVSELIAAHREELLDGTAPLLKNALEKIPPDFFYADLRLVHIKAETLAHLGDFGGAIRTYKEVISQRGGAMGAEAIARYQNMANVFLAKKDYPQALNCLRSALSLMDKENSTSAGDASEMYWEQKSRQAAAAPEPAAAEGSSWRNLISSLRLSSKRPSLGRWVGGISGLVVWAYLWFGQPDIGLTPEATKLLGLLCLTLIYWAFWVFPDYGVALIFVLGLILTGLGTPEEVLSGFASTTWFMTLGVLGLGAAITTSGLFYRISLQLVRFFPLTYYWQIIALGFMGTVITALIPQQTARTAISSQMLLNLSESLGYKTPSKASTGLFAATFLGLGQLGFLYLTGSTSNLLAWGLLPKDVRAQFTWGYWFLAALPPTLIVIAIILVAIIFLFRPESQSQISYKMVENQLEILGPVSKKEWLTLVVLVFMVGGWLTFSYHRIDSAWISLIGLCVLINAGVLGWGMVKKGIDWEMLIYLGATLSIPAVLTKAKIDQWLVSFISPIILPFIDRPYIAFIIIALLIYALKLIFTSGLAVITLTIVLIPLAAEMEISPWIIVMLILVATEVWFFPFQVDWHTLANSTTDGKGFSYRIMSRINPIYAVAYLLALIAAIPYWRYLGLIG
ncbi:MAG TPA: SLC13 family permease [Candidatus Binatia bacterium]|jgi:anion transporter